MFVEPDPEAGERLERYVALVLHHLYGLAAADGDPDGEGSKRGTKVVVDEAASFMRLQKIPHYLDIGRGSRVQLAYVLQNWPQLRDVIGQDKAKRAWGSTEFRVVGAGTDPETAQEISKLSGKQRVTFAGPRQRNWERRREQIVRPVIAPEHITGLKKSAGASEWAVTLGPKVELVRVRKPDQFFFARALPPDPDWDLLPLSGVEDAAGGPGADHGEPKSPPPDDGPSDPGTVYRDNVTEIRGYRKPPRRRPRETSTDHGSARSVPVASPTEEAIKCDNCGGENPPGRTSCRGCRRPLAPPPARGGARG